MKTGEYYLEGVREVGSGFRFNADNTFDFFFSYGAIDRMSQGTWEQRGDSLVLNTARKPQTDFILVTSKYIDQQQLTIQIHDPNPMILGYIYCRISTPNGLLESGSNSEGTIIFDHVSAESISLLHELWPDRFSDFAINPSHNYFEFTIAPWIKDVAFIDLALRIQDKTLLGAHPLMQGNQFRYVSG